MTGLYVVCAIVGAALARSIEQDRRKEAAKIEAELRREADAQLVTEVAKVRQEMMNIILDLDHRREWTDTDRENWELAFEAPFKEHDDE